MSFILWADVIEERHMGYVDFYTSVGTSSIDFRSLFFTFFGRKVWRLHSRCNFLSKVRKEKREGGRNVGQGVKKSSTPTPHPLLVVQCA